MVASALFRRKRCPNAPLALEQRNTVLSLRGLKAESKRLDVNGWNSSARRAFRVPRHIR